MIENSLSFGVSNYFSFHYSSFVSYKVFLEIDITDGNGAKHFS